MVHAPSSPGRRLPGQRGLRGGETEAARGPRERPRGPGGHRRGRGRRPSKPALATKLLSLSGVFAVHKPKGPTSAELLNRLKEKLLAGTAAGWGPGGGHAVAVRAEAARSMLGFLPFQGSSDKRKGKGERPLCKLWTEIWSISG